MVATIRSITRTAINNPQKSIKFEPYLLEEFLTKVVEIITDYAAAVPDFSAVIFRYFNPVGAHPGGLIGEAPNGTPNNLTMINDESLIFTHAPCRSSVDR